MRFARPQEEDRSFMGGSDKYIFTFYILQNDEWVRQVKFLRKKMAWLSMTFPVRTCLFDFILIKVSQQGGLALDFYREW